MIIFEEKWHFLPDAGFAIRALAVRLALDANIFIRADFSVGAVPISLAEETNIVLAGASIMAVLIVGALGAQSLVANSVAIVVACNFKLIFFFKLIFLRKFSKFFKKFCYEKLLLTPLVVR